MSARCPICYKEMHIIEDNLYEGMRPQGIPLLRTIYIYLNVLVVDIPSTCVHRKKPLF